MLKQQILAKLALLTVAVVWGSSLVVVKSSTDTIPPNFLLALRFTIACITLCIIFHRKLKLLDKDYLKCGFIIGLCLFAAYCSQTLGVIFAMPGKSAFLSSSYCVIVPFLFWIADHKRPNQYNLAAAFLCTVGIIAASATQDFSITKGDSLALLSALLFAAHIVSVAKYGRGKDPILITILQFGFSALFSWVVSLLLEEPAKTVWTLSNMGGVLYLSLACTALSLLLQNVGQKYTDPSSASLLLSMESVFGILFSIIFYQETVDFRLALGFVLILTAIIVSETKLYFLKKKF
ncbi:EamA-like transporter family protein [Clostridium sp. C105KSO15]|nr:EamA-like transporter family protein [Clostridium sp. C105KSO15]